MRRSRESGGPSRAAPWPPERLLEVEALRIGFRTRAGLARGVEDVSLRINRGEALALVGESGSGKSVTARAIMRLLPKTAVESRGAIRFAARDGVTALSGLPRDHRSLRAIRGGQIAMIFQDPTAALSPVHTIGAQIMRTVILHRRCSRRAARQRAGELLERVRLPRAGEMLDRYPHQMSGGMRQRAMIALALSGDPALLIADEPTTALDRPTEVEILRLLRSLRAELGLAVLFITHNLRVVPDLADRVAVIYAGGVVETGHARAVFDWPMHPYTRALLQAIPGRGPSPSPNHGPNQGPKLGLVPGPAAGQRSRNPENRRLATIPGAVPGPFELPAGCPFHPRCGRADATACPVQPPPLLRLGTGRQVQCHHPGAWAEVVA